MNPILFAIPVFMLSIVFEAWLAWRRGKQVYDIADALTSLHLGVLSQVSGYFMKLLTFGLYLAVYENYRMTALPIDSVMVWVGALLAYDLCYYWLHRMGHEVSVLWAAHIVHHSSEYYNLSTALRQTSTGSLLGWIFYLPMAVAGVPPAVFGAVALIDLLYQYWVHTELVGRLGWLDRVFVTPSNHRVHHGQNDYCIDRNYGGILIVWDRLFGSFTEERADEPVVYGIRDPLKSFNPLWGNLHYYAELWRKAGQAQGWGKKLGVWISPPGGWDVPLAHFVPSQFQRHAAAAGGAVRRYAVVQYALLVPFVVHVIAIAKSLALGERSVYALGIVATMLILGALLEARRAARTIEQCRVLALGLTFAASADWFGQALPLPLRAAMLLCCVASAGWLQLQRAPSTRGVNA
jgi:sterol desaturase/sphingolipid hydroxylase (fatty acid hydroxylase superfamily)